MRLAYGWPFYSGKAEDADKAKEDEDKAKQLKILTNSHWPVKQQILSNLSFSDKRALAQAFPGLEIQVDVSYKRQERQELLNKKEIISVPTTSFCKWVNRHQCWCPECMHNAGLTPNGRVSVGPSMITTETSFGLCAA